MGHLGAADVQLGMEAGAVGGRLVQLAHNSQARLKGVVAVRTRAVALRSARTASLMLAVALSLH